jgi:single-strand DNA-binding protein
MFLNKVIVFGRLVKKPETKQIGNDNSVTNARIAFSPSRKGGDDSSFINVQAFGKTGELLQQYGDKGSAFIFDGHLIHDKWVDKTSGDKRSSYSITVTNLIFPGNGKRKEENGSGNSALAEEESDIF